MRFGSYHQRFGIILEHMSDIMWAYKARSASVTIDCVVVMKVGRDACMAADW